MNKKIFYDGSSTRSRSNGGGNMKDKPVKERFGQRGGVSQRAKSIDDIDKQFYNVYEQVRNTDTYRSLPSSWDEATKFQVADAIIKRDTNPYNNQPISQKDKNINKRINQADRIVQEYKRNINHNGGNGRNALKLPYTARKQY